MPKKIIKIPRKNPRFCNIEIYYLCEYVEESNLDCSVLMYLQSVRSGVLEVISGDEVDQNIIKKEYERQLQKFVTKLAGEFESSEFDVLIGAPSSRNYVDPYLKEFQKRFNKAKDLTKYFKKDPNFFSGESDRRMSPSKGIKFIFNDNLSNSKSVLIVDDILSTGETIATMIEKLQECGLPKTTKISIACPLLISKVYKRD